MQFDRQPDGALVPLPAPCVDTGMGLERLAAILQHVHSNYEIDLFQALIRKSSEVTATADLENKSLRVIADHIRACSFLIVDGVLPSNEGRGYVLRRIIRRALRHGWMLGVRQPFFHKLVGTLVEQMGEAYPELTAARDTVERAPQGRGRALRRNARRRHEDLRRDRFAFGHHHCRRRCIPSLRHLRFPGRPDRGHRARARSGSGYGRFRVVNGTATRDRARGRQVRRRHDAAGRPGGAADPDSVPGL